MPFCEWALELFQIHAEKTMSLLLGIQRNNVATTKQIHFRLIRLTTSLGIGRNKKCFNHCRPFRHSYEGFRLFAVLRQRSGTCWYPDKDAFTFSSVCVCECVYVYTCHLNYSQFKYGSARPEETAQWHLTLHLDSRYINEACCRDANTQSFRWVLSPPQIGSILEKCTGKFIFSFHAQREVNSASTRLLWL